MPAPQRIIIMGVSGCGKSSVGAALADGLGGTYRDGDDLHPPANVAKMAAGQPLIDDDRWPWLAAVAKALHTGPAPMLIGCSALKRAYRDILRAPGPVQFVHLAGSQALIAGRMAARQGHYMPPSLLASQFAALEPPGPDEGAIAVSIDQPVAGIVDEVLAAFGRENDTDRIPTA